MRNHVHRTSANGSDTARGAGRKARNALLAVRTETSDMIPAAGSFLSRAMYTTSYGVSYGMIFPVLLIGARCRGRTHSCTALPTVRTRRGTRSRRGWGREMGLRATRRKRAKRVMRTGNQVPTRTERRFQNGSDGKAPGHAAVARGRVPRAESDPGCVMSAAWVAGNRCLSGRAAGEVGRVVDA